MRKAASEGVATPTKRSASSATGVVKKTYKLPLAIVEVAQALAVERNQSVTDIIRAAIWIEKKLSDEIREGGTLYVELPDKSKKELVLRID